MSHYAEAIQILRKKLKELVQYNDDKLNELKGLERDKNNLIQLMDNNTARMESIQAGISFLTKGLPVSEVDSIVERTHQLLEVLPEENDETVGVTSNFDEWQSYVTEVNKSTDLLVQAGKILTVEAKGAKGFIVSALPVVSGKPLHLQNRIFDDYVEMCKVVNTMNYLGSITENSSVDQKTFKVRTVYVVRGAFSNDS